MTDRQTETGRLKIEDTVEASNNSNMEEFKRLSRIFLHVYMTGRHPMTAESFYDHSMAEIRPNADMQSLEAIYQRPVVGTKWTKYEQVPISFVGDSRESLLLHLSFHRLNSLVTGQIDRQTLQDCNCIA